MNRTKYRLLAVSIGLVTLLSACQKESLSGHLELVAEGMGGAKDSKMYVRGASSYWQTGDSVSINGNIAHLTVDNEHAYVNGEYNPDESYCVVFPGGLMEGQAGSTITVNMPAVYHYKAVSVAGVGMQQVLDAPLACFSTAAGGALEMKHLTGALNIHISGPSDIVIDRIIIGTRQHHVMCGPMQFDLSDMNGIASSATSLSANNSVEMLFDRYTLSSGTVQIPIPVLSGDVNFSIRVEAHVKGTKYIYTRQQETGGHLGRGVIADVMVDMNDIEHVAYSHLFYKTTIGGKTYYQISSPADLKLMSDAVYGNSYREDGDDYMERWVYDGVYYKDANYVLTNDIDMSGYPFTSIAGFNGEFNGNGHTINNLTVTGNRNNNSYTALYERSRWGVFCAMDYGESVTIRDITFNHLKINGNHWGNNIYVGALFGTGPTNLIIEGVTISDFCVQFQNSSLPHLYFGGLVAEPNDVSVINSDISFGNNLSFTSTNCTDARIGGIVANNPTNMTLDNVSVDWSDITFSSTGTRYFGGISGYEYSSSTINASSTTINGNIIFTAGSNTANKISPIYGTLSGIDASGLTITQ